MKPCWYCNGDGSSCEACDERQALLADLCDANDEIERLSARLRDAERAIRALTPGA